MPRGAAAPRVRARGRRAHAALLNLDQNNDRRARAVRLKMFGAMTSEGVFSLNITQKEEGRVTISLIFCKKAAPGPHSCPTVSKDAKMPS